VLNSDLSAGAIDGAGGNRTGIANSNGTLQVTNSTISASGANGLGIVTGFGGGAPTSPVTTVRNSTIAGTGVAQGRGLQLSGVNPEVHVSGSILVSGGSYRPVIQSDVTGASIIRVATSQLDGGNISSLIGTSSFKCVFSYDETLAELDVGCVPIP
jgi:hypothetical protein